MKRSILFLGSFPPPKMGPSLINKKILGDLELKEYFIIKPLPINTTINIKCIEKFSFIKVFRLVKKMFNLIKTLSFQKYDLVYFTITPTGIGFFKDLAFVAILKLFRVNILYHLHGKGLFQEKCFFKNKLYAFCFKNTKIILTSPCLRYEVEEYVDKEDIFFIPNGVESVLSVPHNNKMGSEVKLLFLGNMIQTKGVFISLEAVQILKKRGVNFKFYFVGAWCDISEKIFNDKVEELGVKDKIKYLGFKEGQEKQDVLQSADIFIYPTYKDTFPLVLLEAMQSGLPVISTDEGAIADIVDQGETGFLVLKKNSKALAEQIESLVNNQELRLIMSKNARRKFLDQYTWEKFIKRLKNVFIECSAG